MPEMTLLYIVVVLFLIMDPIGNIASYLNMMQVVEKKRRYKVLFREVAIAFAVMIAFNYLGEYIFSVLGISETTVRIGSGVILFFIAIKILFTAKDSLRANLPRGEPFIVPLAIPLIAGPATLATIMLFANLEPSQPLMLTAIVLATAGVLGVFLLAPKLNNLLGNNGLLALEKLMGMVLVLLAVQRLAEGIQQLYNLCQGV